MAESGPSPAPGFPRASGEPRYFGRAACRSYPTEWWFADGPDEVEANVICLGCPVRAECLAHALDRPNVDGVWGATNAQQRAWLRRTRIERRTSGT